MPFRFSNPPKLALSIQSIRMWLLIAVLILTGCGKSDESSLVPVHGKIICNGQPVKDGSVSFLMRDGSASFSGLVQDGHYRLGNRETGVGAIPGDYRVSIVAWEQPPGMEMSVPGKEAIPKRYFDANTSGLNVKVPCKGAVLDFELKL